METQTTARTVKINRWLPYWAVLQADVRMTLRSWIYRTWVSVTVLAVVGYLIYHVGIYQGAGIVQQASKLIGDLLRWTMLGSITLIIALTAGCISSERGTMADSVLSRGISRYQYYMGKWHARLAAVMFTFLTMGALTLLASYFLLHEDLKFRGCLVALVTVAALLLAVVSGGVMISAFVNSTVLGVAIMMLVVYGSWMAMSFLPTYFPSPNLAYTLKGYYDLEMVGRLTGWSALASCAMAIVGQVYFARRDV
jgi:ABC-2 type transport system permease protein